jgi:tetratricopeptide (TPR) repeat protein
VLAVLTWVAWVASACDRTEPRAAPTAIPTPDLVGVETRVGLFLEDLRAKVEASPTSVDAWGVYAMALDAHEMYDEAAVAYREARRLDPDDFRWSYLQARVVEVRGGPTGTLEDAADLVREATRVRPFYAPAYVRLGDLEALRGNPAPAEEAYRHALELNPRLTKASCAVARILVSDGRTDEARALMEGAAATDSTDWEVQTTLTRVYAAVGERALARAAAERAKALPQADNFVDPAAAEPLSYGISSTICFKRARALASDGQFESAIQNLKVVLEAKPDYAPAHGRLGLCYVETGEADLAITHLRRAIELDSTLSVERIALARLLEAKGEAAAARRQLEQARALDPALFTSDGSVVKLVGAPGRRTE